MMKEYKKYKPKRCPNCRNIVSITKLDVFDNPVYECRDCGEVDLER